MSVNHHLEEAFTELHEGKARGAYLDIGPGAGRQFPFYHSTNAYTLIELSTSAVWQLRQTANDYEERRVGPRLTIIEEDVQIWTGNTERLYGGYHGAIFVYSLSTMNNPGRAVKNVTAALQSGARLVILDYINTRHGLLPHWLARRCHAYDPSRSIDELVGDASLRLVKSRRFDDPLPTPSLYVFTKV